ncbi:MAG: diaminopimelate epimerase [Rubrivivax sp.]
MRLRFTKMQGAGNDFVVLDAVRAPLALDAAQVRHLADRRLGIGADQVLLVEPATAPGIDFNYRIYNSSGAEVEHCGNGARCLVRYVHDRGFTTQRTVRVQTVNNVLELRLDDDGQVTVDMNRPLFDLDRVPFEPGTLLPRRVGDFELWRLGEDPRSGSDVDSGTANRTDSAEFALLSMGNPHAVTRVDDVATAPVSTLGPRVECDPHFPNRVNVGFMQVLTRSAVRLRVHERGAGETLACGTGACAAVVAGIRLGWLDSRVQVQTRGGDLSIEWPGGDANMASVMMTGPAVRVFEGEIDL